MCAAYRSPKSVCCVFNCYFRTSYTNQEQIKLYSFPRKGTFINGEDLLFKWIEAIKLPRKITKDMKVCSRHFTDEDFITSDNTQMLKSSAIPSVNLPSVWRNKFYPRDYGRLIKLLEFRGIGRLRLCYEAKLGRRIKEAEERIRKKAKLKAKKKQELQKGKDQNYNSGDLLKLSTAFSLASESIDRRLDGAMSNTNQRQIEESLTSEIMIKEEPISDPEEGEIEILDKEETVEEMLARMNEDSSEIPQLNNNDENRLSRESFDTDTSICEDCGEEDCPGHMEYFECFPCNKIFKSARQLNAHYISHFEHNAALEMVCKVCSQIIPADITMSEHMNRKHSNNKSHVCMLCDKAFRFKSSLMQHVNSHAVLTSHRCKICGRSFNSTEELDDHVKTHRAIKREYTCRQCGQKFTSKYSCWVHLNTHMRNTKLGLTCQICGRVLSTRATLKEHMFIHSGEKPFECQLCGRKIRHRANFIIHVQGHSLGQPHLCLTCGMGFSRKSELNSHIAAEHPEDRPYHCIICGLRFRSESRFHKHAVSHDAYLDE
ncbi:hypothetical protein O3M35_001281 [Rhynocoris fuscipes]|uniref:Uncharacterized protein n=1 Tax=Rhynocoris fuscipes TaxID=488301 RepID=A0AAW1DPQ3_9HEMI